MMHRAFAKVITNHRLDGRAFRALAFLCLVYRAINRLQRAGYLEVRNRTSTGHGAVYHPWDAHTYHIREGS